jgi:NAD(P)-dependent dehydrogenase (short-subunit alcohol dehydrogenase family)
MEGRVCIVTGASSGIGKETTRGLARIGATVVLACRDRQRGEAARREIAADTGSDALAVMDLDLRSQASVRAFAEQFAANHQRLHVLVNNAGLFTARRTLTVNGVETTFAVNHLSPFLLTRKLLPLLKVSAPSRIVNVASEANQLGRIHLDDLNLERRWSGFRAYCQSKLANILFAAELARRLPPNVTANALHPGGVRTNLARRGGGWFGVGFRLAWPFLISAAKGADTVVWLASSPKVESVSGRYFEKRRPIEPNPIARDLTVARRLWEISESLTGLRTPPAENTS